MRTYQHIIDTKAVKKVINAIPEYCVVRELTERDYGIDLMIELFTIEGKDKNGHDKYDTTGHICFLQIKGTDKRIKFNADDTISYTIDKKALLYVEKFSTPFIFTRVYTNKSQNSIYFLWLQRYISDVLDIESPKWRTDNKASLTIYIPKHNNFNENFQKIERIAYRIKYIEEFAEFSEEYFFVETALHAIIAKQDKFEGFDDVIKRLKRLSNLSTLLTKNHCCIDKFCILELIEYLKDVRNGHSSPIEMEDYPHNFNLEQLKLSIAIIRGLEKATAENEDDTTY